jgi:beta-lactam-binding protein with PASTA domain/tRNA A-37 threonylcarbamoyl transferase component Bud32
MTEVADNTLVDGRYRIVQRIGSGGMADVYRAEDTHLGREVALKVLHRRFAQDQEFVERFRREAKSAAGLQHPNVVGVYDRGEHDGTYYIAMEHLRGRTLKQVVEAEAPLPQQQVVDLGLQILAAAAFAHRHGVIHRDFKPHNVIVDDAGQAKVTDFGIARAGASEMTETGSIMGTAQYLSPEQAQGHAVTPASDLYSIGVMLYELLAGKLPFEGDSAVAVALKHLSEPPPPIHTLRPDVSPAIESVVMAALAKDPEQRWQSADDFSAALGAAGEQLEVGANGTGEHTAVFAPVPVEGPPPPPSDEPPVADGDKRPRRWPWFTLGLLTLLLAGLLAFIALSGVLATEKVDVPRVQGKQLIEARAALERRGFEVAETRVQSAQPLDQVVDQDPNPGVEADKGATVTLEVSAGPGTTRVPSVTNLSEKQAVRTLNQADLKVNIDAQDSDDVRSGLAIRTVPGEGEEVEKGTRVRLLVSSGPEQVDVPDVVGVSSESAQAQLDDAGLRVAVSEQESEEPEGQVVAQDPGAGTSVDTGTTVTITVSTGVETVSVPDVTGLGARLASSQLSQAGLQPVERSRTVTDETQDGVVLEQRPAAGSELEKGKSVVVIVGKFVAPPDPGTLTPDEPDTGGDPQSEDLTP